MARPASWWPQLLACWPLETSLVTWTFGGDATVLADYALTTTTTTSSFYRLVAGLQVRSIGAYTRTRLKSGDRVFSVAAAKAWNELPLRVRSIHFEHWRTTNRRLRTLFCILQILWVTLSVWFYVDCLSYFVALVSSAASYRLAGPPSVISLCRRKTKLTKTQISNKRP